MVGVKTPRPTIMSVFMSAVGGRFLTPRARRMFFVTSLAAYIHSTKKGGELEISKLNGELNLSIDQEALKFPVSFCDSIWKGSVVDSITIETAGESEVTAILGYVPKWLKYGEQNEMQNDVRSVLAII